MGKTFSTGLLTNGIWQDASNNIGIGGSPSGSYKLEVTGTAKVSSTLLVSGAFEAGRTGGAVTAGDLSVDITSTAAKVIIGRLSSVGSDNTTLIGRNRVGTQVWSIDGGGVATFSSSVTAVGATFSGTTALSSTGGTSQMRIDRSGSVARIQNYDTGSAANISLAWDGGNVGIGTSSPTRKLDVLADAIKLGDTGSFLFDMNVGASSAYFINFGIGATNFLRLRGDGYVNLPTTYNNTTATGANLAISTSGFIERSTSSIRFKTEVEDLTIDTSNILSKMRPIWYRSLGQNDRKDWSWYGFIAEEMAEIEPRLVHWGKDENDNNIADGIQYERISVLLVAEMQKMNKLVQELSAQNQDLKSRLDKARL